MRPMRPTTKINICMVLVLVALAITLFMAIPVGMKANNTITVAIFFLLCAAKKKAYKSEKEKK